MYSRLGSDSRLFIYEGENNPCFSLELSNFQFINYSLHIIDLWQPVTAIWQLDAAIYTDGAYSVSTAAELQPQLLIRLYEGASFSPDRLHNRPEAARYLLTLVTACSDRNTHTLSKFS
jgi:hypothetical protein